VDVRLNITDLTKAKDLLQLKNIISEMADSLDILYLEDAPNGVISARQGRIAQYKNGTVFETWQNVDGGTTWQRIDSGAALITGDWVLSTVTTARTGWTNVSATYANKFIRISATPLGTGGADTHSHTIAANNLPEHTHAAGTLATGSAGAHTHGYNWFTSGEGAGPYSTGTSTVTVQTSSNGAHTHDVSGATGNNTTTATDITGANVPVYIAVCTFQKD
jgi:hypothetical protein